jgi:hypothetical protein
MVEDTVGLPRDREIAFVGSPWYGREETKNVAPKRNVN